MHLTKIVQSSQEAILLVIRLLHITQRSWFELLYIRLHQQVPTMWLDCVLSLDSVQHHGFSIVEFHCTSALQTPRNPSYIQCKDTISLLCEYAGGLSMFLTE